MDAALFSRTWLWVVNNTSNINSFPRLKQVRALVDAGTVSPQQAIAYGLAQVNNRPSVIAEKENLVESLHLTDIEALQQAVLAALPKDMAGKDKRQSFIQPAPLPPEARGAATPDEMQLLRKKLLATVSTDAPGPKEADITLMPQAGPVFDQAEEKATPAMAAETIDIPPARIQEESLWDKLRPETASNARAILEKAAEPEIPVTGSASSVPVATSKKPAAVKEEFKKTAPAQKNKITGRIAYDFGDFRLVKNKRYKFPVAFAGTDVALSEIELRILKIAYQHKGQELSLSRMAEGAYGGSTFSGRGAMYRSAYSLEKRLAEALGDDLARRILHVQPGSIRMTPIKAPGPKTPKP